MLGKSSKLTFSSVTALAVSFVVFALSAFVLLDMTFGWIANNRDLNAGNKNLNIVATSQMTTASCYALHYDGVFEAICEEITGTGTAVTMSEYDKIFFDRNVNTPLIFRVVVTGVPDQEDSYITINIPCFGEYKNSDDEVINNLSNVMKAEVGCGLYDGTEFVRDTYTPVVTSNLKVEDNVAIFTGVRDAVKKTTVYESGTFFEDDEKKETIVLSIAYDAYKNFIFEDTIDEGPVNCLVLNLVFDYDDDLIDDFINSSDSADTLIRFESDIGTIFIQEGGI